MRRIIGRKRRERSWLGITHWVARLLAAGKSIQVRVKDDQNYGGSRELGATRRVISDDNERSSNVEPLLPTANNTSSDTIATPRGSRQHKRDDRASGELWT